jgi:hypothetical protein
LDDTGSGQQEETYAPVDTQPEGPTLAELIAMAKRKFNQIAGNVPELENIQDKSYQEILNEFGYSSYGDYVSTTLAELGINITGEGFLEYIGKGAYRFIKGKIIAEGTGEVASNLGKAYGKNGRFGAIVENPHIQVTGFSGHAVNQAITRGVKTETIQNTVKNPVAVLSQQGGNRFAHVSQEAVVVVDKSGNIVTVWGKDTFDDVVKQVLKDAVK